MNPDPGARAVTRRAFLRSSGLLIGLAGVAACTGRSPQPPRLSVFPGGMDLIAGARQRFTFLAIDHKQPGTGRWDGSVEFKHESGTAETVPAAWRTFEVSAEGEPQGFNVCLTPAMPEGLVDITLYEEGADVAGTTTVAFLAETVAPGLGSEPPGLVTPTRERPRGYEEVCTRRPACGLHSRSLDEVLGSEPALVVVGSPLLCESRTCGPVLEEVLAATDRGRQLATLHVEPYTTLSTVALGPLMKAWGLPSEPWTFVFDAQGTVAARYEGPVTSLELSDQIALVI